MTKSRSERLVYCQMCGAEGTVAALWERIYLGEVIGHARVCWSCFDTLRTCGSVGERRDMVERLRQTRYGY